MKEVPSFYTFGIGALLLRNVRYRLQTEFRQCGLWDEQARVSQNGSFAYAPVPTARLCRDIRD